MDEPTPVVVRAVLIAADGSSDESECLELRAGSHERSRPDQDIWRLRHYRAGELVFDAPLARIGENWVIGAGQDCDAPVRRLEMTIARPGEYLTLHPDGPHGTPQTFRIVNVDAAGTSTNHAPSDGSMD
jgi:hypothetical protein